MFRPTGFADLAGRRVGLYGYGVEGRAAQARLRDVAELVIVDEANDLGPEVLVAGRGGLEALMTCDVVLKSPGIPRRREDVTNLESHGVTVTSALNLWLHDSDRSRIVAVTGTKGKSTTTALVTFFLRCIGEEAQRLGNIGQPPYDPSLDTSSGWLILEVSSFQAIDLDLAPAVVVVTSLGADHVDWHGSLEQYRSDKLSLTRAAGDHQTLVADSATLRGLHDQIGGDVEIVVPDTTGLAAALGLIGAHNDSNVALALRAVETLTGIEAEKLRAKVHGLADTFVPLRGRLTLVATEEVNGVLLRYVDDGLATSVLPAIAALEVFADEPVALIAGGFDRGVEYGELADALVARIPATTLITSGNAGLRISDEVRLRRKDLVQHSAKDMLEAVQIARASLERGGVVLLSPAAPSFDRYRNWEERSEDFTSIVRSLVS
ncbi:MAG: UDP-N-acetylmuramoyl-L-alanine--D-glutamate ligase [Acidimicrobiales bacterium]